MNLSCKMFFIYTILYNHKGKKIEYTKKSFDVDIVSAIDWVHDRANING